MADPRSTQYTELESPIQDLRAMAHLCRMALFEVTNNGQSCEAEQINMERLEIKGSVQLFDEKDFGMLYFAVMETLDRVEQLIALYRGKLEAG
jgi:hypothetical protein